MRARLLTFISLALAVAALAWIMAANDAPTEPSAARIDVVLVQAPDDATHGTFNLTSATPLSALEALAAAHDISLVVEGATFGGCSGTWVTEIDGVRSTGAEGWVYDVWDGETWQLGELSAACMILEDGQSVRWRWGVDA